MDHYARSAYEPIRATRSSMVIGTAARVDGRIHARASTTKSKGPEFGWKVNIGAGLRTQRRPDAKLSSRRLHVDRPHATVEGAWVAGRIPSAVGKDCTTKSWDQNRVDNSAPRPVRRPPRGTTVRSWCVVSEFTVRPWPSALGVRSCVPLTRPTRVENPRAESPSRSSSSSPARCRRDVDKTLEAQWTKMPATLH